MVAYPSSALHFNPRSPHGERQYLAQMGHMQGLFQSTLPARGATHKTLMLSIC